MKKFHLSLFFSLLILTASSQKVYFVYIQTESEQPFYVKMKDKVVSSSASGYIILSKLVDSTYNFNVGFPQSKWPDQNFSVSIGRRDRGYVLKNFEEKGWGLFDLQSLAVQMSTNGNIADSKVGNKDVSAFTDILSKAADDPSLKDKSVQPKVEEKKAEEKKPEVSVEVTKKEDPVIETKVPKEIKAVEKTTQAIAKSEEIFKEVKEKPVGEIQEPKAIISEPYKSSLVKKWSESSTTEGFGLVFIDEYQTGVKDTIRLTIPNPKPIVAIVKEEPKKDDNLFLDLNKESTKQEEEITKSKPEVSKTSENKTVNPNSCSEKASESDFFKLRKKMAGEENNEGMISEAKKVFKSKCFSTVQIKNLSALFLTDEGKYNFFDLSYKHVSDIDSFSTLQSELNDEYYSGRFKAMLRN